MRNRPGDRTSDAQILQALESKLVPAARNFRPDFILISAGFDAMRNDLIIDRFTK